MDNEDYDHLDPHGDSFNEIMSTLLLFFLLAVLGLSVGVTFYVLIKP